MQKILKWSFLGHFLDLASMGNFREMGPKKGPKNRYFAKSPKKTQKWPKNDPFFGPKIRQNPVVPSRIAHEKKPFLIKNEYFPAKNRPMRSQNIDIFG